MFCGLSPASSQGLCSLLIVARAGDRLWEHLQCWGGSGVLRGEVPRSHRSDVALALACAAGSRASSSLERYRGHWVRFVSYCSDLGVRCLPAQPLHVAMFLSSTLRHCAEKRLSFAVVKSASAAIFTAHHLLGEGFEVTDHPLVANVRKCARKLLGARSCARRKAPAPLSLCLETCRRLAQSSGVYHVQVAAFIMLCFAGLLRFNDAAGVRVSDIQFGHGFMVIYLRKRKNDQFRQGSSVHVVAGTSGVCPVALTRQLISLGNGKGPFLFKHLVGLRLSDRSKVSLDGSRRFNYGQARRAALRELALTAGISLAACAKLFGTHSFRIGGTTLAHAKGVSVRDLQRQGGWRDERSVSAYIKPTQRSLLLTSQAMGY